MGSSFFVQIPLIAKEEKPIQSPGQPIEETKLDIDKTSVNKYFDE